MNTQHTGSPQQHKNRSMYRQSGGGKRFKSNKPSGGGGGRRNNQQMFHQMLNKAKQAKEKYLTLARECVASGNRVEAENYYQHVDHYIRVISELTKDKYVQTDSNMFDDNDFMSEEEQVAAPQEPRKEQEQAQSLPVGDVDDIE